MEDKIRVILFGAVLLGIFLTVGCIGGDNTTGNNLVYPGSQSYSFPAEYYYIMNIPSEGVTVKAYRVSGVDIETILDWFENKMNSSGWNFKEKYPVTTVTSPSGSISFSGVLFRKGDRGKGIWAWQISSGSSETYYVIASGPWSKFSQGYEREQLPKNDQATGEEPIQRYPGSVMLNYKKNVEPTSEEIYIDYGTSVDASVVANWYKQYLQNEDWYLKSELSNDTGYTFYFIKGNETIEIAISKPTETRSYTKIEILYTKEKLPEKDLTSGYEPIPRYPGSVMVDYTNVSYGGMTTIGITYMSAAGVDEVVEWYQLNLPTYGWVYTGMQSVTNGKEITFTRTQNGVANMIIQVTSENSHTNIDISYISS